MANKVLVVDDEKLIVKGIKFSLEQDGMEVTAAYDGKEAYELAMQNDYDIILLDVMLPELNGFEVLRRLRKSSDMPVIMLTARDTVMDKVAGLDGGADDYMTKPFAIEELLARIRLALKKRKGVSTVQAENQLSCRGLTMDIQRYEVTYAGNKIELTHREFELLKVLLENRNIVISRDTLLEKVCGYDYFGETNIIDVYVRYLRSKLDDVYQVKWIQTVRGVGYVIRDDE